MLLNNMCLFPKLILNKKYLPNKKNNFNPPKCNDLRVKYVPIGCGKCIECLKQKARGWQIRLIEELKLCKGQYVTLTFSNDSLKKLCSKYNLIESNAVATKAVRLFLERYRKKYKKSCKHWFVTELGHDNSERIHLHGIIFVDDVSDLEELWKYGHIRIGEYCNEKTINYIIKYIHKIDDDHKNFVPIVLCSSGLGKNYINDFTKNIHKFETDNFDDTIEFYRLPNGQKVNLPIYYRNHFFSEKEREKLWCSKIDKGTRYVLGTEIKIDSTKGQQQYMRILKKAQETNKELGFGDDSKTWQKMPYNITLRMLNKKSKQANHSQKANNSTKT